MLSRSIVTRDASADYTSLRAQRSNPLTGAWHGGLLRRFAPRNDGCALPPRKLVGAELAGDLVEHGVHHAGFVAVDKGVCDVDIFGYHDSARHVLAMLELVGTCPQHRTQNGVDPLQRPA